MELTSCLPFAWSNGTAGLIAVIYGICLCNVFSHVLLLFFNHFLLFTQAVSDAAGQGVTITGNKMFNNWNWPNAVIFAATVITTIGK